MKTPNCVVCKSDSGKIFKRKSNYRFFKCQDCGLVYIDPLPQVKDLYDETYYFSWGLEGSATTGIPKALREMKLVTFGLRLKEIEKHIKPGKFLDVGCATGFALEVAEKRGWEPHGVELSEYSSSIARDKFGFQIVTGTIFDADYPDDYFDAVMLSDLLEHVPDPEVMIAEMFRILKPGGILSVITPNVESMTSKVMGRRWIHYKLEHLFYFSPGNMTPVLERNGFELISINKAKKGINLFYFLNQMEIYGSKTVSKPLSLLGKMVPSKITSKIFLLNMGEMEVIAKKGSGGRKPE